MGSAVIQKFSKISQELVLMQKWKTKRSVYKGVLCIPILDPCLLCRKSNGSASSKYEGSLFSKNWAPWHSKSVHNTVRLSTRLIVLHPFPNRLLLWVNSALLGLWCSHVHIFTAQPCRLKNKSQKSLSQSSGSGWEELLFHSGCSFPSCYQASGRTPTRIYCSR